MSKKILVGGIAALALIVGVYAIQMINKSSSSSDSQDASSPQTTGAETAANTEEDQEALRPDTADIDTLSQQEDDASTDEEAAFGESDAELLASESDMQKELKAQIDKAIKSQIETDYADLLSQLALSEDKKSQLIAYFTENKQHQQDLIMLLMEENRSVDEVMDKQDKIASAQKTKLESILNPEQRQILESYDSALPEKSLKKQVSEMLNGASLPGEVQDLVAQVYAEEEIKAFQEGKSVNLIQNVHTLSFTADQYKTFQHIMEGSQHSDPAAIKENLAHEEEKLKKILSKVPDQYKNAVKEKLEAPLNMQRNVIKMMEESDS